MAQGADQADVNSESLRNDGQVRLPLWTICAAFPQNSVILLSDLLNHSVFGVIACGQFNPSRGTGTLHDSRVKAVSRVQTERKFH